MEIKSTYAHRSGQVFNIIYNDINGIKDLGNRNIQGVHAYCFFKDKLVIVYHNTDKYWTLPGGRVEKGEALQDAVSREVKEETNMKVVSQRFIGVQDIFEPQGIMSQTRSVCLVEPFGPFVNDPDGDISEIKLIDPKDLKLYVDWGEIGDHLLSRAIDLKTQM